MTWARELPARMLGATLDLRPLVEADREPLFQAASDPGIWAGHPTSNRHERAAFTTYFDHLLTSGGSVTVRRRDNEQVIGCSRFYEPPETPGGIAIGSTFLVRTAWGGAVNRKLKALMLGWAFERHDHVWLHIDPENLRSQRATAKLGARLVTTAELVMAGRRGQRQCWRLDRDDFVG